MMQVGKSLIRISSQDTFILDLLALIISYIMKKLILLFFVSLSYLSGCRNVSGIMLCNELPLFCQNGYYTINDNEMVQLHLHDGTYSLDFDLSGGDVVYLERISTGSYVSDSGYLVLHDSILGYRMKMQIVSEKNLKFCNVYCGLHGSSLTWLSESEFGSYITELDVERIKEVCKEYQCQDKTNTFSASLYVYSNINHFFDLSFSENGTFRYLVYDIPLLEGSYERIGNVLVLHDREIEEPFYVLIEKEGIIPFLPGIFGMRQLKPYIEHGDFWSDNPNDYDWYIGK